MLSVPEWIMYSEYALHFEKLAFLAFFMEHGRNVA